MALTRWKESTTRRGYLLCVLCGEMRGNWPPVRGKGRRVWGGISGSCLSSLLFPFQGQSCLDISFAAQGKRNAKPATLDCTCPFFKQNLSVTHFGRQFFLLYYLILVLSPSTFILFLLFVQQGRWQQNPRKLHSQGLWPLQSMAVCEAGH